MQLLCLKVTAVRARTVMTTVRVRRTGTIYSTCTGTAELGSYETVLVLLQSIWKKKKSTGLFGQAMRLTLSPGVHELVGQIRPPNMFWTPPGPPEDDPARHKSISEL